MCSILAHSLGFASRASPRLALRCDHLDASRAGDGLQWALRTRALWNALEAEPQPAGTLHSQLAHSSRASRCGSRIIIEGSTQRTCFGAQGGLSGALLVSFGKVPHGRPHRPVGHDPSAPWQSCDTSTPSAAVVHLSCQVGRYARTTYQAIFQWPNMSLREGSITRKSGSLSSSLLRMGASCMNNPLPRRSFVRLLTSLPAV